MKLYKLSHYPTSADRVFTDDWLVVTFYYSLVGEMRSHNIDVCWLTVIRHTHWQCVLVACLIHRQLTDSRIDLRRLCALILLSRNKFAELWFISTPPHTPSHTHQPIYSTYINTKTSHSWVSSWHQINECSCQLEKKQLDPVSCLRMIYDTTKQNVLWESRTWSKSQDWIKQDMHLDCTRLLGKYRRYCSTSVFT